MSLFDTNASGRFFRQENIDEHEATDYESLPPLVPELPKLSDIPVTDDEDDEAKWIGEYGWHR